MPEQRMDSRRSSSQVGVRDPSETVTVDLTRAQGWEVYDLLVARAVALAAAETEARASFGSRKYRDAAERVRSALL